jgi:hypothetical protein
MINLTLHQYFISFSLSRSLGHKFTSNNNSTSRLNRLCIPVSSSFSIRFFPGGKGKGKELVNYTGKILKEATPMTPISSQNPSAPLHTVPTTVPTTKANFDKCQPMGPSIQEQYEKSHPTPVSTTTTTGTPFLDTYNSIHPNSPLVKYTGGVKYTGDVPQSLTVYQPTSLTKPLPLTKPSLQENLKPNDKVKKAIDDVLAPAPHTLPVPIPAPVPTPLLLTSSTPTDSVPPTSPVPSPSLPLDISCESFSESFPIPPAPSLPPSPLIKSVTPSANSITFAEELKQKVAARELRQNSILEQIQTIDVTIEANRQTHQRIDVLFERRLLQHRYDALYKEYVEEYLTAEFYKYYIKSHRSTETLKIDISDNLLQDCKFHLGLLKINNVEETALLSGIQMHVSLIYIEKDGKKVAWGYLTSQKSQENFLLSAEQPFTNNSSDSNSKAEYVHIIKPFVVEDNDFQTLSESDLREKGELYLNKPEITKVLTELFSAHTIPALNKGPIHFYDSTGVTNNEIDNVICAYDKEQMKIANKQFQEYKQKTPADAEEWLEKMKATKARSYPYLKKLIDKHNEQQ